MKLRIRNTIKSPDMHPGPGSRHSRRCLMAALRTCLALLAGLEQAASQDGAQYPQAGTGWHSTNPGAGGAFGAVGAGPGGVIIVGGDLAGAYRSMDRGQTWDLIGSFRGLTCTHICGLGYDPLDESVLYIGTEHGLYRSADTGSTVSKVINDGYITDVTVDPADNSIAYAAFHSKYNTTDGKVYKSSNRGLIWEPISADLPNGIHIQELWVNPDHTDTLYLLSGKTDYASGRRAAYRSMDGGVHWTQIGASLGEVKDLKIDKSNPSILYLSTYLTEPDDFGYLYRSVDNGDTWMEVVHRTGYIWLDPADPGFIRMIELGFQYPGGSRSGIWASSDTGMTWYRLSDIGEDWDRGWSRYYHYGRSFNGDVKTFGEDMSDPDVLFWITSQWVFGSFDGGLTFKNLYTNEISPGAWQSRGINNAVLFDIEISPANHDVVYLGYFDLGLFRSLDHGLSWENCNHPTYTAAWKGDGGSSYAIAADPTRPNVVWASQGQDRGTNKVLLRSSDCGEISSWERSGTGLPATPSLLGLSVDPYSPDSSRTLFIAAGRNIYRSVDDGYNWSLVLDCGGRCIVTAIDRFKGSLVYAGGSGGIWRSLSGGASGSWEPVGLPEMQGSVAGEPWEYGWSGVMDIETDPLNFGRVYVAVFGTNKGLYRSEDMGETWAKLLKDDFLRGVAVSPADPRIIWAVSSKPLNAGGYNERSNGVLRSLDGGENWEPVNEGLSWPFASAVEIDPVDPALVMIASPGEGCCAGNFAGEGPLRYGLLPRGTLPAGTRSVTLSLSTDTAAECRYSSDPGMEFSKMQQVFSTGDGIVHSAQVSDLSDGGTYTYYCRCRDEAGNVNEDDYYLRFSVQDTATGPQPSSAAEGYGLTAIAMPGGGVEFNVKLAKPGDYVLTAYDLAGRQVWSHRQEFAGAGLHAVRWVSVNPGSISPGSLYIAVLSSSEARRIISLLFTK